MVFQNADVEMPIISTNGLAQEDNDVTYRKHDGYVYHVPTKDVIPFIARDGVYFMQLLVPKSATTGETGTAKQFNILRKPDFPRHG